MKIIYILTCLGVGGAQLEVLSLADRLATAGHSIQFIAMTDTPAQTDCETEHPILQLHMTKSPLGLLRALRISRRFLLENPPDIVHSHMYHANVFARLLRLFVPIRRLICTAHNTFEGGKFATLAYRWTDRFADLTTNVSREATDRYLQIGAAPAGKIMTVYNGIDTGRFRPNSAARQRIRWELGIEQSQFMWLAVGRLAIAKDYPNLLHAFQQLLAHQKNAALYIAGAGDQGHLRALAHQLGIAHVAHFLGVRQDIPQLMNAADGFVLSSAWEGFGLVVAEAMATEKPTVATDCGGVSEVVSEYGELVPRQNASALAAGMLRIAESSEGRRQELGVRARAHIEREFGLDRIVQKWMSLYSAPSGDGPC